MGVRENILADLEWLRDIGPGGWMNHLDDRARDVTVKELLVSQTLAADTMPIEIAISHSDELQETTMRFGHELLTGMDADDAQGMDTVVRHMVLPYKGTMFFWPEMFGQIAITVAGSFGVLAHEESFLHAIVFNKCRLTDSKSLWAPMIRMFQYPPEMAPEKHKSEADTLITARTGMFDMFHIEFTEQERDEREDDWRHWAMGMLMSCYGLINMKQAVKTEVPAPAKLNRKRERQGKVPISAIVQVKIDPRVKVRAHQGGTHASPRPHWRRGHVRTLSSGKRVAVSPHMVMGEAPLPQGYVVKK